MTINVDLFLLETWQRFQDFCFHVARAEYVKDALVAQLGLSWDGGRDIVIVALAKTTGFRTVALQCKFVRTCGRDTKRSIVKSLDAMSALDESIRPDTFVLCMPINPTGRFLDWLQTEMTRRDMKFAIWGRAELLARLEKRPDIFETFFYRVFAEVQRAFVTDDLELVRLKLVEKCHWVQRDPNVLAFSRKGGRSPDLVLDVVVRNRGRLEAVLTKLVAIIDEWAPVPRGLFRQGLLFPKITYSVSLGGGRPGRYECECEPPLVVRPRRTERFRIKLTDTGATWTGIVRIGLATTDKLLPLPVLRLYA